MLFEKIFTVSELNRIARGLLESKLADIQIEGEISSLARPASGHWYFTLKDAQAQIRCAMFRNRNFSVRFQPQQGDYVYLRGKVSLFEARGEYQLIVEEMTPAGAGRLLLEFERLKQRLAVEGLFDETHKQPLPDFPTRIGIVTSSTGAAIRDILKVLARRFPMAEVIVYPALVQGEQAATEIAAAIATANERKEVELLIVGRGGGSIEDLWAFNEEQVARAIYASELPIISAVGHETDTAIADFVADLRAPTPSAAAELVSPDQAELKTLVLTLTQQLMQNMGRILAQYREQLQWRTRHLLSFHPAAMLEQQQLQLDYLSTRVTTLFTAKLQSQRHAYQHAAQHLRHMDLSQSLTLARQHLIDREQALRHLIEETISQKTAHLTALNASLLALSPQRTLKRGYCFAMLEDGTVVTNVAQLARGDHVKTVLQDGAFESQVTRLHPQKH